MVLNAVAATAARTAGAPAVLRDCVCFICNRGDYFVDLEVDVRTLIAENIRLMDMVEQVQSGIREGGPTMRKISNVKLWLNRVDEYQDETVQIITDAEVEIKNKCIRFFCPKSCSYNGMKIRVQRKRQIVGELLVDGQFTSVVERNPDATFWKIGWELALQTGRRFRVDGLIATADGYLGIVPSS